MRIRTDKGAALLEAALVLPLLLLVAVSIFEFGRAFQTWQVLTNAAREGARIAVTPSPPSGAVEGRVRDYMRDGGLPRYSSATVTVDRSTTITIGTGTASASLVTINYPFQFVMLGPVASLVRGSGGSGLGSDLNMQASALMRNEAP